MIKKTLWVAITGAFVIVGVILGYYLGDWWTKQTGVKETVGESSARLYLAIGSLTILVTFCTTYIGMWLARTAGNLERVSAPDKVAAILGIIMGMIIATLLASFAFPSGVFDKMLIAWIIKLLLMIICCSLCLTLTLGMKDEIIRAFPKISAFNDQTMLPANVPHGKLLDTNVIIDGRLTEIVRSGFIEGPIYIPSFVLNELQHIADSADALRRARGRRGLDVLNEIREQRRVAVNVYDKIDPAIERLASVDEKLVALAKAMKASIVTNDFNLNKVAGIQGVIVLNVNELANALKPVVLPGEEMTVEIVKEGREENQGVGYLADGTMVVVENGKQHIGETLQVAITSTLQTVAGKMIFAELRMAGDEVFGEGDGSRGGRRPRHARRS